MVCDSRANGELRSPATHFYPIGLREWIKGVIDVQKKSKMNKDQKNPKGYVEEVYSFVRQVPFGKVCTYGIIADCLALGSARMVGWALNRSLGYDPPVPAHRIVNRKGELSGRNHFPTPTMMQELLESEGIDIEDNKVKHLSACLFNPLTEE